MALAGTGNELGDAIRAAVDQEFSNDAQIGADGQDPVQQMTQYRERFFRAMGRALVDHIIDKARVHVASAPPTSGITTINGVLVATSEHTHTRYDEYNVII